MSIKQFGLFRNALVFHWFARRFMDKVLEIDGFFIIYGYEDTSLCRPGLG